MGAVRNSAYNTQAARLPAITIPTTADAQLRQTLEAVKEHLEVRGGARGNPYERAVTVRDLVAAGVAITVVGNGIVPIVPGRVSPSPPADGSLTAVRPQSVEDLLRRSLADEAARLGASIGRLERRVQSAAESSAMRTEQLTASLGRAAAGVREVSYASATANQATAGKVTQLVAALDGTGSASLEESMVVIADRTEGLRSQYFLKLTAGNVVSGISLLASEDPGGVSESAFIVQADKFQVKTVGGTKTPIGVDGSDIYLNGTVRINAGGQTLTDLATNAAVPAINYLGQFASPPATTGLKKNTVYKNTSNGNTYILNTDGGAWALFLEKGAPGANGTNGTNGAPGNRGSITLYRTGTWSDAGATSAILAVTGTGNAIGDTVTFTNGTVSTTRYWSGSGWVDPGVIINGNLLVGGVISSTAVNTSQYVSAAGAIDSDDGLAAIYGRNDTHNGHAIVGITTSATGQAGGRFLGRLYGAYGSSAGGVGVYGRDLIGTGVRGQGAVGVDCQGALRWGNVQWAQPDGTAAKYLDGGGNWKRPSLSDINPSYGDMPNFQFSTDGGTSWTGILLRRIP